MRMIAGWWVLLVCCLAGVTRTGGADATPAPAFHLTTTPLAAPARATLPLPSTPQARATMKRLQAQWRMVDAEDTLFFKDEQRLLITSPTVALDAVYTVNDAGALGIQIGLPNAPVIVRSVSFPDADTLSLTDVGNKQTIQYKRVK